MDCDSDAHDLSTTPLVELLISLQRSRASGELVLERGRARKTLGLLDGALVSVESSLPSEGLCARLRDAARLPEEEIARAERLASERGTPQAAAVASLRLLEPRALVEEIRECILASTREAMLWPDGRARFDAERVPSDATAAFRCDVLPLVHATIAGSWTAERIANDLAAHFAHYPSPRDGLAERMRRWLRDDAAAVRLVSLLDGDRTIEAVMWLADRTRLLRYAEAGRAAAQQELPREFDIEVSTAPAATPSGAAESAAPVEPAPETSPEAEEIRKEVLALHELLGDITHYEILGIEATAAAAAIKKASFKAAKRYHPDKLTRLGLDDVKEAASEVFAGIAEAHEVLADAERRRLYDEALASGGATEEVDITRIAQAESFFRKGEILVKMGDFRGAAEMLETAVELWPDECIYQATLGWARFRKNPPDNDGAAAALRIAVGLDPQSAQAHLWLGQVLRALGDVNGSAEHAARARRLDPKIG
jgi:curved DNA-binding protein CbpA